MDTVAFGQSVELLWKGMLSIFVVIGVIFIVTVIMSKLRRKKKDADGADVPGNTGE